jgi:hypothetical protein
LKLKLMGMTTTNSTQLSAINPGFGASHGTTELRRISPERNSDLPAIHEVPSQRGSQRGVGDLDLSVRAVRMMDIPRIARMSTVFRLNQPEIELAGYSAMKSAIRSISPGGSSKPRLFVASAEDRLVGFIHFQPAYSDRRWHVIAVGTGTGVYDASPVEDVLIRHGITAAGLRGVKRLFARVQSGSDLVNTFAKLGFTAYATETIFVTDAARVLGESVPVREQEQTDTWAIHQLYNATVPKTVQYAEALTSHRWDLRGPDELVGNSRRLGWLVDDGHSIAAYGRVACGANAHAVELLYLPDRTHVLGGLIDTIVQEIRTRSRSKRIICTLRGYQAEAAKELESRGFDPVLEQDLHVKYTTVTARAPQPEPLALHAEVIERLPKRVPSFLQQKHQDETAV